MKEKNEKKKTSPLEKLLFLTPNYHVEEASMAAIFLQNYLPCLLHAISESDTNSGILVD